MRVAVMIVRMAWAVTGGIVIAAVIVHTGFGVAAPHR
jgi:hypothetical protein